MTAINDLSIRPQDQHQFMQDLVTLVKNDAFDWERTTGLMFTHTFGDGTRLILRKGSRHDTFVTIQLYERLAKGELGASPVFTMTTPEISEIWETLDARHDKAELERRQTLVDKLAAKLRTLASRDGFTSDKVEKIEEYTWCKLTVRIGYKPSETMPANLIDVLDGLLPTETEIDTESEGTIVLDAIEVLDAGPTCRKCGEALDADGYCTADGCFYGDHLQNMPAELPEHEGNILTVGPLVDQLSRLPRDMPVWAGVMRGKSGGFDPCLHISHVSADPKGDPGVDNCGIVLDPDAVFSNLG